MKYLNLLISMFVVVNSGAQTINIDNTQTTAPLPKFFTGAGMADINNALNFIFDATNTYIVDAKVSPEYIQLCKDLKIASYRFPEGTGGNYYHFYGTGNGLDSNEIFCNDTYYGIRGDKITQYQNKYNFDKVLNKNYAYYFVDFMKEMKQSINDAEFYYHLNTHTHIYQGELKAYTNGIQYLLNKYFNNQTLLNTNYNTVIANSDTNQLKQYITTLNQIKQDSVVWLIKYLMSKNPDFQYHFQENMNSVRYFVRENVGLKGIELGNEIEAEYMLFDDDFSRHSYRCTNDTNTISGFSKLLFRDFTEGMLKYWLITSLYADSIHTNFNLPVGIPISGFRSNISFDNNGNPYLLQQYGGIEKDAFFWSKFFATDTKFDAYIPHIYSQKIMDCNKLKDEITTSTVDAISQSAITYIDYFVKEGMNHHLNAIHKNVNGKPLWITEWNLNFYSFLSNTFLHAYLLNEMLAENINRFENNQYNVDSWLLHYLSSSYFGFALIKNGYDRNKVYSNTKLLTYEPFAVWSSTLQENVKSLANNITTINNAVLDNVFVNKDKNQLIIHYSNLSTTKQIININNLTIQDNSSNYSVSSVLRHILQANTLIASNYVECDTLKKLIPDSSYKVIKDTTTSLDGVELPPFSIGKIVLQLKNETTTSTGQTKKKCIFSRNKSKSSND